MLGVFSTVRELWCRLLGRKAAAGGYWLPVANVMGDRGTKHFRRGAKVHYLSGYWGMGGERVTVAGHHRKSKRFITIVVESKHLTNWRVQRTFHPYVIRALKTQNVFGQRGPDSPQDKAEAERVVAIFNSMPVSNLR